MCRDLIHFFCQLKTRKTILMPARKIDRTSASYTRRYHRVHTAFAESRMSARCHAIPERVATKHSSLHSVLADVAAHWLPVSLTTAMTRYVIYSLLFILIYYHNIICLIH